MNNDSMIPSIILGLLIIFGVVFGVVLALILFTTDEAKNHLPIWYDISLSLVIIGWAMLSLGVYILFKIFKDGSYEFPSFTKQTKQGGCEK